MSEPVSSAPRPAGVTAIAGSFFLAGGYLALAAALMKIFPGTLSMTAGSPLLHGLELGGPYMFLLCGGFGALTGFGLLRLDNWARRAAIIICLLGMIMLVPSVSAAATSLSPALFWNGLGVIVRVIIVWYLFQVPVTDAFSRRPLDRDSRHRLSG